MGPNRRGDCLVCALESLFRPQDSKYGALTDAASTRKNGSHLCKAHDVMILAYRHNSAYNTQFEPSCSREGSIAHHLSAIDLVI